MLDLILLLRFHRPLFKFIPDSMKKGGLLFCGNFMIENELENWVTKKYSKARKNELLNFKHRKLNLIHFYQGKDNQRDNLIQSAVLKKL